MNSTGKALLTLGTTIFSIIADKRKRKKTEGEDSAPIIETISFNRTANGLGTASILVIVGTDIAASGCNKFNLIGLFLAVFYSIAMAYLTFLKEGKNEPVNENNG
jgi:hypothetical protein